uniref:Globin, extracellular monomeric n=1 Tax=Tubifex tubifex TaxID=6386 RepID=GLB_TUBTU|nr:RecName: Full=Globin, extracellular monomeric [Tubifex tubifex]
ECDALQRFKVKHQWAEAFGTSHHRLDFGLKLWNSIFRDAPEIRGLFKRVDGDNAYSAEFEAHAERVLGGLDMTISLLDDQAAFDAQLAHLKSQHAERNIKADYYGVFVNELLAVLPDYLGTKLDFKAWSECLGVITGAIHD